MKNLKLLQILLLLTLSACYGCDEELTTLPPETQTGANTFGCYIGEKLFVAQRGYGPFGGDYLGAGYTRITNILNISAYGKESEIGFAIINPQEGMETILLNAGCRKNNILYREENIGKIYFTKFDTVNKIVSGTFACNIKLFNSSAAVKDSTIQLVQGRFDIKLDIYNH